MFLAINEIRHSKLRYALVIGVMFLIAYLVFFLSGLAYGLAQENRMAVDKWNASDIFLSEKANDSLNMSMIESELANELTAKEKRSSPKLLVSFMMLLTKIRSKTLAFLV